MSTTNLANHSVKEQHQTDLDIPEDLAVIRVHRPPHHTLLDPRATNILDLDQHLATLLALQDTHQALTKDTQAPIVNVLRRDTPDKDLLIPDRDRVDHLEAILAQDQVDHLEDTQVKDKTIPDRLDQHLAVPAHLATVVILVVPTLLVVDQAAQAVLVSPVQDLDLEALEAPVDPLVQAAPVPLAQDLQDSLDPLITELMKMVITPLFLGYLTWIIPSSQRYQKPHSDVMLNRTQATTLMLKLAVKCSMCAPITELTTFSALMEPFSPSKSLFASGGTNLTATLPLDFTN